MITWQECLDALQINEKDITAGMMESVRQGGQARDAISLEDCEFLAKCVVIFSTLAAPESYFSKNPHARVLEFAFDLGVEALQQVVCSLTEHASPLYPKPQVPVEPSLQDQINDLSEKLASLKNQQTLDCGHTGKALSELDRQVIRNNNSITELKTRMDNAEATNRRQWDNITDIESKIKPRY